MMKIIKWILLVALCLSFQGLVLAEEKISLEDALIGSTFKALAKAFVAVSDIEKLKKNNIYKLEQMEEEKFNQRYLKVYEVIKDLPEDLKHIYRISEDMTKEEVIAEINSVDKTELYETIDSIPDRFIADQFRGYLHKKKHQIEKNNLVAQIQQFWAKIIKKSAVK